MHLLKNISIYIKTYIIIHIKIYIIFLCLLVPANIQAQSNKVPPFRMIQSDGRAFVASQLPFDKHILIIYFSPDCEECQKLTSALTGRIKDFQNVSIAMITYQHPETMRAYVKKNNLLNYNNIFVGTEYPSLFVRNYYNIMHFPYMALYDKNGNLVRKYTDKEIDVDDLLKRVGTLK